MASAAGDSGRPRPQPWLPAHASRAGSNARSKGVQCDDGRLWARQHTRRSARTAAASCRPIRSLSPLATECCASRTGREVSTGRSRWLRAGGSRAGKLPRRVQGRPRGPARGTSLLTEARPQSKSRRVRKFQTCSMKEQHHLPVTRDTYGCLFEQGKGYQIFFSIGLLSWRFFSMSSYLFQEGS